MNSTSKITKETAHCSLDTPSETDACNCFLFPSCHHNNDAALFHSLMLNTLVLGYISNRLLKNALKAQELTLQLM